MWNRKLPSSRPRNVFKIEPDRVLYEFDEPLVFTAIMGLQDSIFAKVDEYDQHDLYISSPTTPRVIEALLAGNLSLLGAVSRGDCILVETDRGGNVIQYWSTTIDNVPPSILPQAGVGLHEEAAFVVDTIEQLDAYFSVRFTGTQLSHEAISFGLFKGLVNDFYEASRKILAPELLARSKSSTFDFPLFAPAFGSLVLSVGAPRLSSRNLKRINGGVDADIDGIRGQFEENKSIFFSELSSIVEKAHEGELTESFAEEHFELLDQLNDLIPTDASNISTAEFNTSVDGKLFFTRVDSVAGERMRKAHTLVEKRPRKITGRIFLINSDGLKFSIRTTSGRRVTCVLGSEKFEELNAMDEFRDNAKVRVVGDFRKRVQRDLMSLDELPEFLEDQQSLFD